MVLGESSGYARDMRFAVRGSALKHGVTFAAIQQITARGDYLGGAEDGLLWWVGTTDTGEGIEVGGIAIDAQTIAIIHALPTLRRS